MTTEIEKAFATSDLYQLLSMALHLPTEEWIAGWQDGRLAEDVQNIFDELEFPAEDITLLKAELDGLKSNVAIKDLHTAMKREYTRLFTHPKKPAIDIYESLFLYQPEEGNDDRPSLFISPAGLDAERCYKKAGLAMDKKVNEPGDHMATEMEFMMFLYLQKAKALQENNQEEVARREAEIEEFKEAHLKKWAKAFFQNCVDLSKREEYQVLGKIGTLYMGKTLSV